MLTTSLNCTLKTLTISNGKFIEKISGEIIINSPSKRLVEKLIKIQRSNTYKLSTFKVNALTFNKNYIWEIMVDNGIFIKFSGYLSEIDQENSCIIIKCISKKNESCEIKLPLSSVGYFTKPS